MKKKIFNGFNFVKKKLSEVTQTAVNGAVNLLEDNQSGDYLKDLYLALRSKQLYIDKETYNKQYIPLNKYYKPEPQTSNPILYIAVISFNQKKGAIVEFTYPDIDSLKNNLDVEIENVQNNMSVVAQVSDTILGSMDEMTAGSQEISTSTQSVSDLAQKTRDNIELMDNLLKQFKA